jgi:hypothetical protein
MFAQTIEEILKQKPHNTHHLNRYIKFIKTCKPYSGYSELHHICPRAKDLFPEFGCLKDNPWNGIRLSARQHFIAHRMLWKAYGGSQTYAFRAMCNNQKSKNHCRVKSNRSSKYYQQNKEDAAKLLSESRKNKTVYKDVNGTVCIADSENPRVLSGELVGVNKNNKFTLEKNSGFAVYKIVDTKTIARLHYTDVLVTTGKAVHVRKGVPPKIYNDTYKKRAETRKRNQHPKRVVSGEFRDRISRNTKGRQWYNDGVKNYRVRENDPLILDLNLVKGRLMGK